MADATIGAGNGSAWHAPRLRYASCLTRLVRPYLRLDSRDPWREARRLSHMLLCMRMRSTIGGSRLERILAQSLTSSTYSANCQTLRQAESRSFVLKASGTANSSKILASSKSKDMGGATGWQVGKQEISLLYGNAKARTRLRTESARDKCTGRCDVTNTDRSPRTLPRAQKPLRSLTRAHALAQRDLFFILTVGKITTLSKNWARSSQGLRRDPKVLTVP